MHITQRWSLNEPHKLPHAEGERVRAAMSLDFSGTRHVGSNRYAEKTKSARASRGVKSHRTGCPPIVIVGTASTMDRTNYEVGRTATLYMCVAAAASPQLLRPAKHNGVVFQKCGYLSRHRTPYPVPARRNPARHRFCASLRAHFTHSLAWLDTLTVPRMHPRPLRGLITGLALATSIGSGALVFVFILLTTRHHLL